jgi:HEPN domain-containing protein/predicted nucleotidyltransferase
VANRAGNWLALAKRDLQHARHSLDMGDYEWECFAAQQGAEKAVKAALLALGGEGWGHSVTRLLADLTQRQPAAGDLLDAARRLDRHYIPTRYPNGFPAGAPKDYYTAEEARPLPMQAPLTGYAASRFVDREVVLAEFRLAAERAGAQCLGVKGIILFGSFAYGMPTPRSDADLLVVIREDADRQQVYDCCLAVLMSCPVPVDLFVLTRPEVEASRAAGRGLAATALQHALRLL